jgi:hypothetical protein
VTIDTGLRIESALVSRRCWLNRPWRKNMIRTLFVAKGDASRGRGPA